METQRSPFEGIHKLYSHQALTHLGQAHVCIVGLGGVGSWTAEALARSGVGRITLIDLDEVCQSNINRQIHALTHTIGLAKAELMAARIRTINPACRVEAILDFVDAHNVGQLIDGSCNFVFDAIDKMSNKCQLIAHCQAENIPVLVAGGAGGIQTPFGLRIEDINLCRHDRLICFIRRKLRQRFGFPKASADPWGIPVVYTPRTVNPLPLPAEICQPSPARLKGAIDCAGALGSACFVTGSMGFFAAAYIVQALIAESSP